MNSHGSSNEVAKFVLDALNSVQWSLQIMNLLFFSLLYNIILSAKCEILHCIARST